MKKLSFVCRPFEFIEEKENKQVYFVLVNSIDITKFPSKEESNIKKVNFIDKVKLKTFYIAFDASLDEKSRELDILNYLEVEQPKKVELLTPAVTEAILNPEISPFQILS